ncbi:MAG: hypothetical protein KDC80_15620, partial [Saprospiraceae bacterium]|nr:hypothetical protein [Saprospiraceae bacterium]
KPDLIQEVENLAVVSDTDLLVIMPANIFGDEKYSPMTSVNKLSCRLNTPILILKNEWLENRKIVNYNETVGPLYEQSWLNTAKGSTYFSNLHTL